MAYEALAAETRDGICRVRFTRADAGNPIDAALLRDLDAVVQACERDDRPESPVTVLVLEGAPEVFCDGGDLAAIAASPEADDPAPLYDLWMRLATGPFVTVSVVRGRANAGGIGFVAASDIVLADRGATFGLSELLFGLFPACVLPFLIRRVGYQKAHYLTLMTRPIGAEEALACGLVDALDDSTDALLRRHLMRLGRLARPAIARYKRYMTETGDFLAARKPAAVAANRALFSDPAIRRDIRRYVTEQKFPWEA